MNRGADPREAPAWSSAAPSDYAGREFVHWPGWRSLIAWDVFLNNTTAGLAVVTMLGVWLAPTTMAGLVVPGLAVALAVLIADLVVLVTDLGDPWRFVHMLRVIKPRSPMSVGVWALSSFGGLLALTLAAALFTGSSSFVTKASGALMVLPALGVLVYKGVLFSCTSQPGLRDARWLSAHLASSGLMLGAAVLTGLAVAMGSPTASALRLVLAALAAVAAFTLLALRRDVHARFEARYAPPVRFVLQMGIALVGFVLPIALLASTAHRGALGIAAAAVLAGGLALRHGVIRLAEPLATANAGTTAAR
jgi:hypothetical protein